MLRIQKKKDKVQEAKSKVAWKKGQYFFILSIGSFFMYVSRYSSPEFQEWSRLQSERAKSNEYRLHSSRHGFVNVEEKIVSVEYLVLHH